jgi:hypothetical protein
LAVAVALVLGAGTAEADTHGWAISDGSAGNWSDGSKWTPVGPPAADDTVHFNDINQTENITVDQNVTVANAWVKWDGVSQSVNSYWTVNLTDDGAGRTVNVTGSLQVMHGATANTGSYAGSAATLALSNLHLVLGAENQQSQLEVGRKLDVGLVDEPTFGILTVSGGSVTAYLNHFVLGRNLGGRGAAYGTVDLSNCTNVMIDVAGNAYLGAYTTVDPQGNYSRGIFKSGGGSVNVSGNLLLADSRTTAYGNGSIGMLYLSNTTFSVGGRALFYGTDSGQTWEYRFAQVYTTVAGSCSGLDLTRDDADALSFSRTNISGKNLNLIDIKFTDGPTARDADNWYWGMRWLGDHETVIEGYRSETYPRLALDVSGLSDAVKREHLRYLKQKWPDTYGSYAGIGDLALDDYIVYDDPAKGGTGYTYIGVYHNPPPAGTVFMLR